MSLQKYYSKLCEHKKYKLRHQSHIKQKTKSRPPKLKMKSSSYTRKDQLNKELYHAHLKLGQEWGNLWSLTLHLVQESINIEMNKQYKNIYQKLERLEGTQTPPQEQHKHPLPQQHKQPPPEQHKQPPPEQHKHPLPNNTNIPLPNNTNNPLPNNTNNPSRTTQTPPTRTAQKPPAMKNTRAPISG